MAVAPSSGMPTEPPPLAPDSLIDELQPSGSGTNAPVIPVGIRNDTLYHMGRAMALAGASSATIESALITLRDSACEDSGSVSDADVRATAASAYRSANMDEGKEQILPEPMTIGELQDLQALPDPWIVEGLIPADVDVLIAGYPKTCKTLLSMELAVAMASGTPFLGYLAVQGEHRVGLVLMEDRPLPARERLVRLALARGLDLNALRQNVFLWFSPPLNLGSEASVSSLARYVREKELDLLIIDAWAYVASGDSNSADEVTPQLQRLSRLREASPGLILVLVHHARKEQRPGTERITDSIRNSSAFGAWFDVGFLLERRDERSPVRVRIERRDGPPQEPFSFTVEDEDPGEGAGANPSGWLKLILAEDGQTGDSGRRLDAAKAAILQFLNADPGCSKRKLRKWTIGIDNNLVEQAFKELCEEAQIRWDPPKKRGGPGRCWLADDHGSEGGAA